MFNTTPVVCSDHFGQADVHMEETARTHISPDDSEPVPLGHLAVGTLYVLLDDTLLAVLEEVVHQHARLKLLHLAQLTRRPRANSALQRPAHDLPQLQHQLTAPARAHMQTTHPPRVVIAHKDHALAVAHDVERDVRAWAAGVGRAAVDEQLVGRLGGVEDDELRRAHAHAEDGAVLACPFEELQYDMSGLG